MICLKSLVNVHEMTKYQNGNVSILTFCIVFLDAASKYPEFEGDSDLTGI